jgi:Txe/YoeB family toxin of toxin-antitoxin system
MTTPVSWSNTPVSRSGLPEQVLGVKPLKHLSTGAWSRRITDEHRLVYLVADEDPVILQARFHYR